MFKFTHKCKIRMHCIFRHEFDLIVLNKTAQI